MIGESSNGKTLPPAAYRLTGATLDGGWLVGDLLSFARNGIDGTGGLASAQYIVTKDGERAFLKALDLSDSRGYDSLAAAAAAGMKAFNFELEALQFCAGRDRIVTALESGYHYPIPGEISFWVPYLIFELADCDVREYLRDHVVGPPWCLRAAHELAVGVSQLHRGGYIHQDIKASNALIFDRFGCKLGDLGSACGGGDDHNKVGLAGSWTYAPPERLYGVDVDDHVRQAGDLFLLGSLIVFMFTQVSMRTLLTERYLAPQHRPAPAGTWTGGYELVLHHLQHSFGQALNAIYEALPVMPDRRFDYRSDLITLIHDLCNPDYRQRGFKARDGSRTLDLGRAITRFRLLAQRMETRRLRTSA